MDCAEAGEGVREFLGKKEKRKKERKKNPREQHCGQAILRTWGAAVLRPYAEKPKRAA